MSTTELMARTLALQGVANAVVRTLLRTPLLGRLVGRRLIVVEVVGRASGRTYRVPVAYLRDGDRLLVGTPFGWGRNLRTGDAVSIRYRGRRRRARVEVLTDQSDVVARYAAMARANRQFARFNGIGYDAVGEPDREDLHRCWRRGARAFLFTPLSAAT